MVKHTQTIRRQNPTNCLSLFDHFVELMLKGLNDWKIFRQIRNKLKQKIKETEETKKNFCKKILLSASSKEIWKIIHHILKPSSVILKANFNELNEFFNNTAKRVTNKIPKQ